MSFHSLPIHTRSLCLRHAVPADVPRLFVLSNEECSRTGLPSQVYRDEPHARAVFEFLMDQYSTPANPRHGAYVLMIEHVADRTLIGHVGFSPFEGDVEIGFGIAQDYQGRGLAVEAISAASQWAFDSFALPRILGITASTNTASRQTLLRANFAHQQDQIMKFQGHEQLTSIYALPAPPIPPR